MLILKCIEIHHNKKIIENFEENFYFLFNIKKKFKCLEIVKLKRKPKRKLAKTKTCLECCGCGKSKGTKVGFPHSDINPGLVKQLQSLVPGNCVIITPRQTPLGVAFIGTFESFECGVITLVNSFTTLTLLTGLILATPGNTIGLTLRSFAGIQLVNVSEVSSILVTNGDICTALGGLLSVGTIPSTTAAAIASLFTLPAL